MVDAPTVVTIHSLLLLLPHSLQIDRPTTNDRICNVRSFGSFVRLCPGLASFLHRTTRVLVNIDDGEGDLALCEMDFNQMDLVNKQREDAAMDELRVVGEYFTAYV